MTRRSRTLRGAGQRSGASTAKTATAHSSVKTSSSAARTSVQSRVPLLLTPLRSGFGVAVATSTKAFKAKAGAVNAAKTYSQTHSRLNHHGNQQRVSCLETKSIPTKTKLFITYRTRTCCRSSKNSPDHSDQYMG